MDDKTRALGNQNQSIFTKFFSHPVVGFVGTIASILGFIFAFYFYYQGREVPQLTYFINPAKATLVKSGEAHDLSVFHRKTRIDTDVTAVQIIVWNDGKKSIKPEHVLMPFILSTMPSRRILEASIRKSTRDVSAIALDQSLADQGKIGITWRILEQGDGARIQVIFAGSSDTELAISGTLEGQKQILAQHSSRGTDYDFHPLSVFGLSAKSAGWIGLGMGTFLILTFPAFRFLTRQMINSSRLTRHSLFYRKLIQFIANSQLIAWLIAVSSLMYIVLSIYLLFFWSPPGPPLGL